MALDPINGLNTIVQMLRQRLSERADKAPPRKRIRADKGPGELRAGDINELRRRIATRLSSLAPDERSSNAATRIFVESVLVWEFGEEMLNDPRMTELSQEVQRALNSAPASRDTLGQLLNQL